MRSITTGKRGLIARTGVSTVLALTAVGMLGTASQAVVVAQQAATLSSGTGPTGGGNTLTVSLAASASPKFSNGFVGVQFQPTTAALAATASCSTNPATSSQVTSLSVKYINTTKVAALVPDLTSITGTSSYVLVCAYSAAAASGTIPVTATVIGKANYIVATAPTIASSNSVVPATGPAVGGQLVTITGTGFPTAIAAATPLSATLDGQPLTGIVPISSSSFTAITPAHPASASAVTLTVTTAGGTVAKTGAFTYKNGITVSPNTVPSGVSVDVGVQGTGFNNLTFDATNTAGVTAADYTNIGTNISTAHVYLVQGTYSVASFASGTNKSNGQVEECINPVVISDTELICTVDTSHKVVAASGVYTWTTANLPNGSYTVTVVDNGYAAPTYQTVLSSGATFTVADF